jgi:hypothetical protein
MAPRIDVSGRIWSGPTYNKFMRCSIGKPFWRCGMQRLAYSYRVQKSNRYASNKILNLGW